MPIKEQEITLLIIYIFLADLCHFVIPNVMFYQISEQYIGIINLMRSYHTFLNKINS